MDNSSLIDKLASLTKEVEKPERETIDIVKELLKSPRGFELALNTMRVDDFIYVIYQGVRSNVWGRIKKGVIHSYNSHLTRLILSDEEAASRLKD